MKPLTREWVRKAEGDYATAAREMRARKSPNYDAACFHAQQCVEKYLKALPPYPGESSDKQMAKQALAQCRRARTHIRAALRLGD